MLLSSFLANQRSTVWHLKFRFSINLLQRGDRSAQIVEHGLIGKYNFDRLGGVQLSYGTFLSLIQDRGFTHGFLKSCQEQYEEAEKRAIIPDSVEYPSFEAEKSSKQVGKKKQPAKKLDDYDDGEMIIIRVYT